MGRNVPSMEINGYAAIFTKPIFKNQKGEWYRDVGYEDSMDLIRENFLGVRKSFVAIGYYLRHLDRKELYRQGGYESIWECAKAEFGLSQTSATRYMQMNEAYSLNGDTPILDERYVEFSKSQLQEMLSLPEEVREEIKPEQTVLEIRQIAREEKKKKEPSEAEIRKFYDQWAKEYDTDREGLKESLIEHFGKCHAGGWSDGIEFQCSLRGVRLGEAEEITWAQFVKRVNEYFPAESCETPDCIDLSPAKSENRQDNEHRQIDIYDYPDYLPEAEKMPKEKVVVDGEFREIGEADNVKQDLQIATSQKLSPYGLLKSEYPPDSLIATEGCGNKEGCFCCAQNCNIRQKERYCVEAPLSNPFSCDTVAVIEKLKEEMGESCQFINQDMAYHRPGDGAAVPCCKECVQPGCNYRCLRSSDLFQENAADNHEEQELKYEDDTQEPVTPAEQLSAIRKILDQEQKVLDDYLRVGGLPVMTVFRQKTIVGALASMVCDLDETDTDAESVDQPDLPDLPKLKNNEERKAWLRDYRDWGRWYRDEKIDVNYYKYDFEDGSRLIVEEYPQRKTYWNREPKDDAYYHLLQKGKKLYEVYCHHADNETRVVDFLKDLQKSRGHTMGEKHERKETEHTGQQNRGEFGGR